MTQQETTINAEITIRITHNTEQDLEKQLDNIEQKLKSALYLITDKVEIDLSNYNTETFTNR